MALRGAALALAVPCAASFAQNGPPRALLPDVAAPPANAPAPSDTFSPVQRLESDNKPAEDMPLAPPVPPVRGGAVQVGDLGTIEGPVAGTLDNSNGGLGATAWQASERGPIVAMLQSVPAATPSATQRLLMRKLLLTTAPAPPGRAPGSFNQLRLTKLLDGGFVDDAADLALRVRVPMNFDILRVQANALLYAGRNNDACSDLTAHRLDTAETFWVRLRAFCYAVSGDSGPLELTRAVIMEQGLADPGFLTLLEGMASGMAKAPDTLRFPDPIHVAMLAQLKLPMTSDIATNMGLPASLIAAASTASPRAVRTAAAEKALRAGMLPAPLLGEILDLTTFTPQELNGAPALARSEPLMIALARLRAALKTATTDEARAELVTTAFQIGEREGLLAQMAALFAEDAAAIQPAPNWAQWSDLMIRGLLLANRGEAAQRWFDILDRNTPGMRDTVDQLELALAMVAPNPRRTTGARRLLTDLALVVHPAPPPPEIVASPPPPDAMPADAMAPDQIAPQPPPPPPPPPKPPQALLTRATLDLGLFHALGELMSPDAEAAVPPLVSEPSPGRRPPADLMQRIDKAALSDARGEVALSVVAVLSAQGARDLAPDVVVRLVRALQTAGIHDAAHALAAEALLLRPRAGAAER
jgi:hypothetical protein